MGVEPELELDAPGSPEKAINKCGESVLILSSSDFILTTVTFPKRESRGWGCQPSEVAEQRVHLPLKTPST